VKDPTTGISTTYYRGDLNKDGYEDILALPLLSTEKPQPDGDVTIVKSYGYRVKYGRDSANRFYNEDPLRPYESICKQAGTTDGFSKLELIGYYLSFEDTDINKPTLEVDLSTTVLIAGAVTVILRGEELHTLINSLVPPPPKNDSAPSDIAIIKS